MPSQDRLGTITKGQVCNTNHSPVMTDAHSLTIITGPFLLQKAMKCLSALAQSSCTRLATKRLLDRRGMHTRGSDRESESGAIYTFEEPSELPGRRASKSNVWRVLQKTPQQREYVAKGPSGDDEKAQNWPAFQHELKMQRLFIKERLIRRMVDYIPSSTDDEPAMVLEPFEQTLWNVRNTRPMSTPEIKWIMKGVLLGLETIHRKSLVHTDLKMENIGISGFEEDHPNGNVCDIIVRIADCGSFSRPGTGEITSLTYRSPEVLFGKSWDQSTDIWSWGIMLAQLLLAQVDFTSPGMYDTISSGDLNSKTQAAREAMIADFDLLSIPLYTKEASTTHRKLQPDETYMWAVDMSEKSIQGEDIQFLVDVLNPRPSVRPSAREILQMGYLD